VLLTLQQEFHDTGSERSIAAMGVRLNLRHALLQSCVLHRFYLMMAVELPAVAPL
jgi:hypothetical protein